MILITHNHLYYEMHWIQRIKRSLNESTQCKVIWTLQGITPLSRISSTLNPNKAIKDILVHYTSQERDEDTGLYTDVVYKGYIQHWHCGSGYQMAIILNTEGRFHRTTIDKIWVEKEDMKQRKSIKVSKEKAIIIASNHNNIPIQKAKAYTDSELREVLRHLNLKPGF